MDKTFGKWISAAWLLAALLFTAGLFGLFSPRGRTAAADAPDGEDGEDGEPAVARVGEREYSSFGEAFRAWGEGATLTLLSDVQTDSSLTVSGSGMTLALGDHTLSLGGESGSVLKVEGGLTVTGGKIAGGKAEQGGGIYVDSRGSLLLEDCEVSGNTATKDGGGIYVTGKLTLAGGAVVEGNTDGNGGDSNIFLSPGNKIALNGFTGRAGVTVISPEDPFAAEDENSTGVFTADDKRYVAEGGSLILAPLASVEAVYTGGKVFPTTDPNAIAEHVTVTGTNVNGVPYAGEISFKVEGTLQVGTGELTVTATGEGGESAQDTLTLQVEVPVLTAIEVKTPQYPPKVYFDSPLTALTAEGGYTFKGIYDDGISRTLCPTAQETSETCCEEYIKDFYTLYGDLAQRENGNAQITVRAGDISALFSVKVSKYVVSLSAEQVKEQSVPEGSAFDARRFVPSLPSGVNVLAECGGAPLDAAALSPGVYEVRLSFAVADRENYEEIAAVFLTRLTVLRLELKAEGNEGFSVTREGGLPPAWRLNAEDVTQVLTVNLEGSLEAQAVYEITLQEKGVVVEEPGKLTVRIPLSEEFADKDVTLFLMGQDGTLIRVEAEREEDALVFTADSLLHARYVVAVETASRVYLILSIVFGVACALGAAALLFYLVVKRKMTLR